MQQINRLIQERLEEQLQKPLQKQLQKPLQKQLQKPLQHTERLCIAIDGRCAAGKTTLADALALQYDAAVVRMDHFFVPAHLRKAGEQRVNVHYERFEEEVVRKLNEGRGEPFAYQRFDCKTQSLAEYIHIPSSKVVIVEGAYSMLPQFEQLYDIKLFADVSKETQKQRILTRNGPDAYPMFEMRWIPAEESYFKEYNVQARCDYRYCTEF